ncbi:MAG: class C sortase [Actinomycetaceae bacterium]|nr:class C sortase [Actinomycetaceae bacterium]
MSVVASLVVIAGVTVFLYPHIASWFSQKEQSRVIALANQTVKENETKQPNPYIAELELAHEYNNALASGVKLEANANVPKGNGTSSNETLDYNQILDGAGEGVMGRLRYASLDIDLPIYHGTSDETLLKGVGHLEGTSLPVGGVGQRSVLTAHRGLPESTLFTHLDKAKKGDIFTVAVLDQVLSYRVIDSVTIEPSDTEVLFADPGKDLVTLITCTPLGINSHRILVTAERVIPTPQQEVEQIREESELPRFPWWIVILSVTLILAGVYIWRSGYVPVRTTPASKEPLSSNAQPTEKSTMSDSSGGVVSNPNQDQHQKRAEAESTSPHITPEVQSTPEPLNSEIADPEDPNSMESRRAATEPTESNAKGSTPIASALLLGVTPPPPRRMNISQGRYKPKHKRQTPKQNVLPDNESNT